MFIALDTVLFTYVPEKGTFVRTNIGKLEIISISHIKDYFSLPILSVRYVCYVIIIPGI